NSNAPMIVSTSLAKVGHRQAPHKKPSLETLAGVFASTKQNGCQSKVPAKLNADQNGSRGMTRMKIKSSAFLYCTPPNSAGVRTRKQFAPNLFLSASIGVIRRIRVQAC
ncbi:hypothetical protein, partial [Azonexus sp.]|uniref:hypothetical protein n=1 Tax=Azonexus sp. TaxID=1872668 RepID=UPI0039E3D3B5